MQIEIINANQVKCRNVDGTYTECQPFDMWQTGAECGNCPILAMCERYLQLKFGDNETNINEQPTLDDVSFFARA